LTVDESRARKNLGRVEQTTRCGTTKSHPGIKTLLAILFLPKIHLFVQQVVPGDGKNGTLDDRRTNFVIGIAKRDTKAARERS
jgi:hypothetical protein